MLSEMMLGLIKAIYRIRVLLKKLPREVCWRPVLRICKLYESHSVGQSLISREAPIDYIAVRSSIGFDDLGFRISPGRHGEWDAATS